MRPTVILGLAVALVAAAGPLRAQNARPDGIAWELGGLRSAFCVQLLLGPTSKLLGDLPSGYHAVPASAATTLHASLRGVIEAQTEFAAWSPSQLCFTTVDAVRTKDLPLTDRSGRHPQLFALWTVLAAGPSGTAQDVAIGLFSSSDRLNRSARLAGQELREAGLTIGKVPAEDENGVPSNDDRFQVKLGGTVVTWDGHPAGESTVVAEPLRLAWAAAGDRGRVVTGSFTLTPGQSQAMAGSLKVDGKNEFAKALRASPTRFVGPAYRGGDGTVTFGR